MDDLAVLEVRRELATPRRSDSICEERGALAAEGKHVVLRADEVIVVELDRDPERGDHPRVARALAESRISTDHHVGQSCKELVAALEAGAAAREHRHARDSIGACLLRLGILPLLMLTAARWLPCPVELRRVMLIQAAMPCAVIPVILAKHYGGDPAMALRIILCTSAAALLTIPWWIQFGLAWLGGK